MKNKIKLIVVILIAALTVFSTAYVLIRSASDNYIEQNKETSFAVNAEIKPEIEEAVADPLYSEPVDDRNIIEKFYDELERLWIKLTQSEPDF